MTVKQTALINEFFCLLPKDDAEYFKEIINYITSLGYAPHKQKVHDFVLSFKNKNGKVLAKIGTHKNGIRFRIKFHACKNLPEWCLKALWTEHYENEQANRFQGGIKRVLDNPLLLSDVMIKCSSSCRNCSVRYYHEFNDGRVIDRCSAYPVEIPNASEIDMNELKNVIMEQHNFFMSDDIFSVALD